jgi:hypothetical protein
LSNEAKWGNPESDPISDIKAFLEKEFEREIQPTKTIHHPNCLAIKNGNLARCNCGGWMFPTN